MKREITYCLTALILLWGGCEFVSAGVNKISPLRTVVSLEAVADSTCPQSFRQLFCTGLISNATCELCLPCMSDTMPDYYCDCIDGIPFHYGLDTVVTDTVWYVAKVSDVLGNGMTAYWFSDSVVSIDMYIACNLKRPNKQLTLSKNSSKILSPDDVKEMLGNAGDVGSLIGNKPIYLRVAPRAKGRVLIYKYGDSFTSQCGDSIFPIYYGIQYALAKGHTVLHMPRSKMRSLKFINWIQKDNEPVQMSIIRGDCLTGDTVASVLLTDSVRPYMVDSVQMRQIYTSKDSLYFSFDTNSFGKVIFRSSKKFSKDLNTEADTTMCQGAVYDNGAIIVQDTTINDTLWVNRDTLRINTLHVQVASPEPQEETMLLKSKELYFLYHGQYIDHFGDYDITEHIEGGCDSRYLLHVEHKWTNITKRDTVITCQGKTYTLKGTTYKSTKTVRDTVENYSADISTITIYTLIFTAPEIEYDTIYLNKTQLPYRYEGKYVRSFGDTTITISRTNTCTRKIQLAVIETKLPLQYKNAEVDTTVCMGMGLQLSDSLVMTDGTYFDSIMIAEDTMLCTTYYLTVTPAEQVKDTLAIVPSMMPYWYADSLLADYGNYDLYLHEDGECDRQVQLTLLPQTEYVEFAVDTMLCHGRRLEIGEVYFTEDTVYVDTVQIADYVMGVRTWSISFTMPEPEQVNISAKESELPIQYADTTLGLGVHNLLVAVRGDCDRIEQVTVSPVEDYISVSVDTITCFGKTLSIGGKEYSRDTVVTDTVKLSTYTWRCTTYRMIFSIPELEHDTVAVATLPVAYADTMISEYGTYQVVLHEDGECDMLVELTVIQTTDVDNVKQQLEVVPTVAKAGQMLKVTLPASGLMQVFDMLGREIRHENLSAGITPLRLYQAGNYVVQIITDDSILQRRILITN